MACSTLKNILCYFRYWVDRIIDFIFSLYWDCQKEIIPELEEKHAFLAESATTLARKIREKELKSEELVRAVIDRIKQVIKHNSNKRHVDKTCLKIHPKRWNLGLLKARVNWNYIGGHAPLSTSVLHLFFKYTLLNERPFIWG